MVKKDLNIGCNLTRGILMTLSNLSFCASLFKKIIILFFFIFGCVGFSLLHRLVSSYSELGLPSSCGVQASQCCWLMLLRSTGLRARRLQ